MLWLALLLMAPVLLIPATFVWYLNIGGLARAMKSRTKS